MTGTNARWRRWPSPLLRWLLPSSCALCGAAGDAAVCRDCEDAYVTVRPRCPVCANPAGDLDAALPCGACLAAPPAFDATLAACDYDAPLDALVLQLKFGAQLALAPWMARTLHDAALRAAWPAPDLLCPVPLGARRLAERGYNQALEVARPLARLLDAECVPRLARRVVETAAQSGVEPAERQRNVRGAFAMELEERVAGRHVGVVDDVMTSGHTLDELARVLKRAGAARVTNFVFARTPPHT